MNSLHQQLHGQRMQRLQLLLVRLGRRPRREQDLHPTLVLQCPQNLQPLVLMANLLQLPASRLIGKVIDDPFAFGILIASPRPRVQLPPQPRL